MSDEDSSGSSEKDDLSWICGLKKDELIVELNKAGVKFSGSENINKLKSKFAAHLREAKDAKDSEVSVESGDNKTILTEIEVENNPSGGGSSVQEISNVKTESQEEMAPDLKINVEFQLGKDDWETFVERIDLFFVASSITDETKKAAILLTKISADTYKLVKNLCSPSLPKDKKFEEIVKLISDHLCPKPSETMERCNFHLARQTMTESVADFVARLKNLATHCNFTEVGAALRDQLVCGLRDHATKTELFREDKLTYEKAFKIAVAREAAEKNASTTDKLNMMKVANDEVHALAASNKNQGMYMKSNNFSRDNGKINATSNSNRKVAGQNQGQNPTEIATCYCCGIKGHFGKHCRHRFKSCSQCNRRGHLAAVCRAGNAGKLQYLQGEEADERHAPDEEASSENFQDHYDFYSLEQYDDNNKVDSISAPHEDQNRALEPLCFNVTVNDREIVMEVDSGSYWSIISENDKNVFFRNRK